MSTPAKKPRREVEKQVQSSPGPSTTNPRRWKKNEMEELLDCIMEHGHKNVAKVHERIPSRNVEAIKVFLRTAYDRGCKRSEEHPNIDRWIDLCCTKFFNESPWKDSLQIARVIKYLSVDGLLENHPLPERCQGVNISEAYRLLYQALMGYPIQPVNEVTLNFIQDCLNEVRNELKIDPVAIEKMTEFLKERLASNKPAEKDSLYTSLEKGVNKPVKMYQRKQQNVSSATQTNSPSLKIVVKANENEGLSSDYTQSFSLTVQGDSKETPPTVINVPVPVPSKSYSQNTEVPSIVPCYNGKALKIHGELVVNGLCAISIKHHKGNCKEEKHSGDEPTENKTNVDETGENVESENQQKKMAELSQKALMSPEIPECLKGRMKRRNSFWNVHRPELSKLTWPENFVSSAVLQDFFHNHLRFHGTFCEPLHDYTNRSSLIDEEFRDFSKLREIVPPRVLPPDERVVNIMEKSRSVQLNDEDLDPETMVHKSRAEFCVTIGEYVRRPPLKRTTSQQMPKCIIQPASRFESLPLQHENLLSKEVLNSEERVSSIIGNQDFHKNNGVCKKLGSRAVLRTASLVDSQHTPAASLPSISNHSTNQFNSHLIEDSGDPAWLRTILSPRDEETEENLPPSV